MELVLIAATILGGIAAVFYFIEKYSDFRSSRSNEEVAAVSQGSKTFDEHHQDEEELDENTSSTPLKDLNLQYKLHDRFDVLAPHERYLLSFSNNASGISLQQARSIIALDPDELLDCFKRLEREKLLVSVEKGSETYWHLSKDGQVFLKNNPGALSV